eukprot:CFRG2463T1
MMQESGSTDILSELELENPLPEVDIPVCIKTAGTCSVRDDDNAESVNFNVENDANMDILGSVLGHYKIDSGDHTRADNSFVQRGDGITGMIISEDSKRHDSEVDLCAPTWSGDLEVACNEGVHGYTESTEDKNLDDVYVMAVTNDSNDSWTDGRENIARDTCIAQLPLMDEPSVDELQSSGGYTSTIVIGGNDQKTYREYKENRSTCVGTIVQPHIDIKHAHRCSPSVTIDNESDNGNSTSSVNVSIGTDYVSAPLASHERSTSSLDDKLLNSPHPPIVAESIITESKTHANQVEIVRSESLSSTVSISLNSGDDLPSTMAGPSMIIPHIEIDGRTSLRTTCTSMNGPSVSNRGTPLARTLIRKSEATGNAEMVNSTNTSQSTFFNTNTEKSANSLRGTINNHQNIQILDSRGEQAREPMTTNTYTSTGVNSSIPHIHSYPKQSYNVRKIIEVYDPIQLGGYIGKHTEFAIRWCKSDVVHEFGVRRRYEHFVWLRECLIRDFPQIIIPPLPPQKSFSVTVSQPPSVVPYAQSEVPDTTGYTTNISTSLLARPQPSHTHQQNATNTDADVTDHLNETTEYLSPSGMKTGSQSSVGNLRLCGLNYFINSVAAHEILNPQPTATHMATNTANTSHEQNPTHTHTNIVATNKHLRLFISASTNRDRDMIASSGSTTARLKGLVSRNKAMLKNKPPSLPYTRSKVEMYANVLSNWLGVIERHCKADALIGDEHGPLEFLQDVLASHLSQSFADTISDTQLRTCAAPDKVEKSSLWFALQLQTQYTIVCEVLALLERRDDKQRKCEHIEAEVDQARVYMAENKNPDLRVVLEQDLVELECQVADAKLDSDDMNNSVSAEMENWGKRDVGQTFKSSIHAYAVANIEYLNKANMQCEGLLNTLNAMG